MTEQDRTNKDLSARSNGESTERIQKVLARSGLGSRRQVEKWIKEGRIRVDGDLAEIGQGINSTNRVEFDSKPIVLKPPLRDCVIAYHKPVGEICTRQDPKGRRTVFDSVPDPDDRRLISVGRLDLNTSGLLLLTTDGALANDLMHPRNQIEREYLCRIRGRPSSRDLERLREGIPLAEGLARFDSVHSEKDGTTTKGQRQGANAGANRWYRVILSEGRYREVRRLWAAVDCEVNRLIRVRYGTIQLESGLATGSWSALTSRQIKSLRTLLPNTEL